MTEDPIKKLRSYIFKRVNYPQYPCMNVMLDEIEAQYMRLPVDADGEVLRIGDEVWFLNGEPDTDSYIVRGYGMSIGHKVDVFLNHADEGWCPNVMTVPSTLVHRKPDPIANELALFLTACGDDDPHYYDEQIEEFAKRIRKVVEQ